MKYIMYNGDTPVCFPNNLHHKDVAKAIHSVIFFQETITSAGDFIIHSADGETEVEITGRSDSLNLDPAKGDEDILMRALREEAKS